LQEHYEIRPSPTQRNILLSSHGLAAAAIYFYLEPAALMLPARQGKQPYFYTKYKVYQTRWFAILKLVDTDKSRTLILNSDCFNSIQAYQQLRYQLCKMERTGAA
jgi:hypothetical protein